VGNGRKGEGGGPAGGIFLGETFELMHTAGGGGAASAVRGEESMSDFARMVTNASKKKNENSRDGDVFNTHIKDSLEGGICGRLKAI